MGIERLAASNPTFRPIIPPKVTLTDEKLKYVELMTACWSHKASKRPDFSTIIATLEALNIVD